MVRKAYGAGYYVMCGKAYEPDLIVAWPSAEISVMGPEGAVNIIFRKQIEASDDPDATRAEMIEGIRRTIDPYIAAGNAMIDDVIDPRETRPTVIRALEMAETKRVERPWKRHRGDARLKLLESEAIFFDGPEAFYAWLEENHDSEPEVLVGFYKKATGKQTMTWSQAVDQALCFGWIDGVMRRLDDERHIQRFTPRKAGQQLEQGQRGEDGAAGGGGTRGAGRPPGPSRLAPMRRPASTPSRRVSRPRCRRSTSSACAQTPRGQVLGRQAALVPPHR